MFVVPMTGQVTIAWPVNDAASISTQAVAGAIREALRKEEAVLTEPAIDTIEFQSPIIANTFRGHRLGGISSGIISVKLTKEGIFIRYKLNAIPILIWAVFGILVIVAFFNAPIFAKGPRDVTPYVFASFIIIISIIKYFVIKSSFPRWLRGRVLAAVAVIP